MEGISEKEYQENIKKVKEKFLKRYGRYPTEEELVCCSDDGLKEEDKIKELI